MENLGRTGKDKITGFEGVITSKHFYLTGCAQYGLQPKIDKDGKVPDKNYFDEGRVEILEEKQITAESVQTEAKGCDFRERPNK